MEKPNVSRFPRIQPLVLLSQRWEFLVLVTAGAVLCPVAGAKTSLGWVSHNIGLWVLAAFAIYALHSAIEVVSLVLARFRVPLVSLGDPPARWTFNLEGTIVEIGRYIGGFRFLAEPRVPFEPALLYFRNALAGILTFDILLVVTCCVPWWDELSGTAVLTEITQRPLPHHALAWVALCRLVLTVHEVLPVLLGLSRQEPSVRARLLESWMQPTMSRVQQLLRTKRADMAFAALEEALARFGTHPLVRFYQAVTLMELGDLDGAKLHLEEIEGDFRLDSNLRAMVTSHRALIEDSITFDRAVALASERELEEAYSLLESIMVRPQSLFLQQQGPAVRLCMADLEVDRGNFARGAELLEQVLDNSTVEGKPRALAKLLLADALTSQRSFGRLEEARQLVREASEELGQDGILHAVHGKLLVVCGQLDEGIVMLERTIEKASREREDLVFFLVLAHQLRGEEEEARSISGDLEVTPRTAALVKVFPEVEHLFYH